MRTPLRRLVVRTLVVAIFAALVADLHAMQLTRGVVSGTVSDASGAIIQGVQVKAKKILTNEELETSTDQVGVFRFVALEPSVYQIEFVKPGFRTKRLTGVNIGIGREVVLNETLAIESAISIDVQESTIGTDLTLAAASVQRALPGSYMEAVPLTASLRDLTRLALLAPTVARAPGSSEISANGQRARQNNFMIDGIDNNDLSVTGPTARLIPEAVSEFQVQIMAYSAEHGKASGAQVLALTRSGTNDWHGQVWNYYRANWMEPLSLLNKRAGFTATPRFTQNQSGASVGGPIRPNHAFVFGLIEANRRREGKDARNGQTATIPTPDGLAALVSSPSGVDQAALSALSFLKEVYPEVDRYENPTVQSISGIPVEVGTIRIPIARPHDAWLGLLRLDYGPTERHRFGFRSLVDQTNQRNVASNRQFGTRFAASSDTFIQHHALSVIQTLSSQLTNEFRFGYVRNNLAFPETDPNSPTINITGAFTIGGLSTFPQGRIANIFQWQDVATFVNGRHSFKLGFDIQRIRLFNLAAFDSKGTWFFGSIADFLNNRAAALRQVVSDSSYDSRQTRQNYFLQDDFKVSRNLTVNVGGRYEYSGVPFGFFGAATPEIAATGVPASARSDKNNWAARFGFAFSPSFRGGWKGKLIGNQLTVVRGGFGMAYDVLFYNILTITASNPPRVVRFDIVQPETTNLFPTLPPKQNPGLKFDPLVVFANASPDIQNPTLHFWNISIQRQFGSSFLGEIGYSGNRSYHLLRQGETNPAFLSREQAQTVIAGGGIPSIQLRRVNPSWGARNTVESTALSEYHALFVQFDKRMARGFLFGSNYTWSANFSDSDEPLAISAIANSSPVVPQSYFDHRNEWSRSIFDRTQRLVFHFLYEIPVPSRMGKAGLLGSILGGWQVAGFSEWQSGQPFTIRTGVDSGGSGVLPAVSGWRPDLNLNGIFLEDPVDGNLRSFSTPIDGTGLFVTPLRNGSPLANSMPNGGNLGRNTFRGPAFANWNFSVAKRISLSERFSVQLRGDFFNLWNHRNFGNPDAVMNNRSLGTFGTNTTDPGGRSMLLALKVGF